ncbi:MAG: DNA internalization-related competence protein ComEC/Rec2 [Lachnospiraceae bacterium]|nr:DNA internalization-related competence protein ComEC/Rec2 [Lachnospiraceae bacterium]
MRFIHKRPLCSFVLAMTAGILTGMGSSWLLCLAAAVPVVWSLTPDRKTKERRKMPMPGISASILAGICLLCFVAGYVRIRQEEEMSRSVEPLLAHAESAELQGNVYKKQIRNKETVFYLNQVILRVNGENYKTHPVLVHVSDELSNIKETFHQISELQIGNTAVFCGTLRCFDTASNEGGFDEGQYYRSMGMDYHMDADTLLQVHGQSNAFAGLCEWVLEKLKSNLTILFSEENAGIVSAMVLGDKELLDQSVNTVFRQAGVAHILVVSGMHMSCIGMCIYGILRRLGGHFIPAAGAAVVLYLYGSLTGFGISARRAFLMFALAMLGRAVGRTYDVLTGLSFALLWLLWENPMLIQNTGLQFSVAAILGVVLVARQLRRWWESLRSVENGGDIPQNCRQEHKHRKGVRRISGLVEKLREAWFVSLGVQLTTMPLVMRAYYEVPLYGIFVNLMVVPLLGIVLCLGICCCVLSLIAVGAAQIFAVPLEGVLSVLREVVSWSVRLPGATTVTGTRSVEQVVLYYVILVVLLYGVSWLFEKGVGHKKSVRAVTVGGVLFFAACSLRPMSDGKICAFLDVGQGDGIYIRAENGTNLFLDGGSSSKSRLGSYTILPFLKYNGIGVVDYWLVSHYDTDHVNGLIEVLEEGYSVRCLVLPRRDSSSENYRTILELAEAKGVEILYLGQGDRLHLGEDTIYCLAPERQQAESDGVTEAADENENCLVFYYDGIEFQGIFAGDVGVDTEEIILAQNTCLARVDKARLILKANHHGSNYSNGERWLNALSPAYCVVSCGENNRYGHPGAEAVERMEQISSLLYYTMDERQISFYQDDVEGIVPSCWRGE